MGLMTEFGAGPESRGLYKWLVLAGLACLLLVPDTPRGVLDSLPVTHPVDGLLLLLLICAALVPRRFFRLSQIWVKRSLLALLVLLCLVKLAAWLLVPSPGLSAKYHALYKPLGQNQAEFSADNAIWRRNHTRFDHIMDLSGPNWRLGFLNTRRFSELPQQKTTIYRDRLPLEVEWKGDLSLPDDAQALRLVFAGELSLDLAGSKLEQKDYGAEPKTIEVSWPGPGSHPISLVYRYDDGSRTDKKAPDAAKASFRLYWLDQGGAAHIYRSYDPALALNGHWLALVSYALNTLALALFGLCALAALVRFWLSLGWRMMLFSLLMLLLSLFPLIKPSNTIHLLVLDNQLLVLLLAWFWGVAILSRDQKPAPWPLIAGSLLAVISLDMLWGGIKLGAVPIMGPGQDWMVYSGMAFDTLRDLSLQGGEPVYYTQVLYRYWLALLHLVFGDAYHPLRIVESGAICLMGLAAAFAFMRGMFKRGEAWLGAVIGGLLLVLVCQHFLPSSAYLGLGETLFILFWLAFVLLWQHQGSSLLMVILLALAALTRLNLLLACVAGLALCFGQKDLKEPKRMLWALAAFAALMLLPLAHNLYYGGVAAWLPQSTGHPTNLILSASDILGDPLGEKVWTHFNNTLSYMSGLYPPIGKSTYSAYQYAGFSVFLAGLIWAGFVWFRTRSLAVVAPMMLPLLAYAPFLMFKADNYYPRMLAPGVLISFTSLMMMARLDPGPIPARERSSLYLIWSLIFAAALSQFAVLDGLGHGTLLLMLLGGLFFCWTVYSQEHFEMPLWISGSIWPLAGFGLLCLVLFGLSPRTGMDMDLAPYWRAAREFLASGHPAKPDYPLLANFAYALPGSFASSLAGFEWAFGAFCGLLAVLTAWGLRWVLKSHGRPMLAVFWPWLFLLAPFQMWFVFARYDVIPLALTVLALVLWLRGFSVICVLVLAAGFWTKFMPILALPPLLFCLWVGLDRQKALVTSLAALAALVLPLLIYPWDELAQPFIFQAARGMTGQSVWYQLYHALVPGDSPVKPWEPAPLLWTMFSKHMLSAALVLALGAWYAFWALRIKRERLNPAKSRLLACGAAAGSILVFILFNRMFSDQFLVWILGLSPLLIIALPRPGAARERMLLMAGYGMAACNVLFFIFGGVEHYPIVTRGLFWCSFGWFLLLLFGALDAAQRPCRLWLGLLVGLAGLVLISLGLYTDIAPLPLLIAVLAAALITWLLVARTWLARGIGALLLCLSLLIAALNLGGLEPYQAVKPAANKALPNHMLACCRYEPLPSGQISVKYTYTLTKETAQDQPLLRLDIASDGGRKILAEKELKASGGEKPGQALSAELQLDNSDPGRIMEIRAQDLSQGAVKLVGYETRVKPVPGGLFINGWDWFGFAAQNWYQVLVSFLAFVMGLGLIRLLLSPRISGDNQ